MTNTPVSAPSGKTRYILLAGFAAVFFAVYRDLFLFRSVLQHEGTMWYGSFHYFVESLLDGHFPYWNPDLQTGTYFYPNIPFLGLLDPLVLVVVVVRYLSGLSTLTGYIYFYLARLLIFGAGSYYLYRHITKSKNGAMLASGILVLTMAPQYLRQPGALYAGFLTPAGLYCILRFLEEPQGDRRNLYLACAALIYGISINIYIPAYDLFNFIFFVAGVFVTGVVDFRNTVRGFRDKRVLGSILVSVMLVLLMTGPGLAVYFKDAAAGGELFPIQRIALKNGGILKKLMVSDIGIEALSETFSNRQGYFGGTGNIVNILFPDIFHSLPFFAEHDLLAEMGGYIGIVPFLFALLGFLASKSRFRFLAVFMMLVIGINMFGWSGVSHKPYNLLQQMFNGLFPPLKMIDMRETFSPFFQLYLCMLVSLGLGIFFDTGKFFSLAKKRSLAIMALCSAVVLIKMGITAYFGGKLGYASRYDLLIMIAVIVFAVCVFAYGRGMLPKGAAYGLIVVLIFGELYVLNNYALGGVLADRSGYDAMIREGQEAGRKGFQYFREPFPAPPNVAFGENIIKVKGALSPGLNHSPFSTKRYYDFLTNVPLGNQLALTGINYPVVRFYPSETVKRAASKRGLIEYLGAASGEELGEYLFIEDTPGGGTRPAAVDNFDAYENVTWLNPMNLSAIEMEYLRRPGDMPGSRKEDPAGLLNSTLYSVEVKGFSPNEITLFVKNHIAGFIYYNDGWSRYWEAFDGARQVPVEVANYNFKAVFLEKGEHIVRFVFNPRHYKAGLAMYYAGMASAIGIILFQLVYARKRRSGRGREGAALER